MSMHLSATTILAMLLATGASAATIPLKAGDYGGEGLACAGQLNATIVSFDGRSFSYPHASKCSAAIVKRSGGVLTIAETCRAAGDGSLAKPDTVTFGLRLHGTERFAVMKGNGVTRYRRCGPVGYFKSH